MRESSIISRAKRVQVGITGSIRAHAEDRSIGVSTPAKSRAIKQSIMGLKQTAPGIPAVVCTKIPTAEMMEDCEDRPVLIQFEHSSHVGNPTAIRIPVKDTIGTEDETSSGVMSIHTVRGEVV